MLTSRGMSCGPTEPAEDGEVYTCGPLTEAMVLVRSRSDAIYYIDTTAVSYATNPTAGTDLLAYVASLPFDGAMPDEARAWIDANIESGGEVTIGPVYLLTYPAGGGRVLELSRSDQPGQ